MIKRPGMDTEALPYYRLAGTRWGSAPSPDLGHSWMHLSSL